MRFLLAVSRAIDALSAAFGKLADWMVAAACVISAGNAFIRYGLIPAPTPGWRCSGISAPR